MGNLSPGCPPPRGPVPYPPGTRPGTHPAWDTPTYPLVSPFLLYNHVHVVGAVRGREKTERLKKCK